MKLTRLWKFAIGLVGAAVLVAQMPVAKQPQAKSKREVEALQAIFGAPDPDARIAAVEKLLIDFADTEFKVAALQIAAGSAQEKGDFDKMTIYAERTLEADPKNFAAMLILASGITQRTREFDLDKEEKLTRAEKFAKGAVEALTEAPKPRLDITDEQWAGAKKDFEAQAHEALGLIAMARKKNDVAIAEFKTAIATASTQEPATKVRLAKVYTDSNQFDDAIALLDQVLADQQLHPAIRQIAQQQKMQAVKGKEAKK